MEEKGSCWVLERVGQEGAIALPEGRSVLGRSSQSDIRITSRFCSRSHCLITVTSERVVVSDFSSNGTFVNGKKFILKVVKLKNNDRLGIGVNPTDEQCARDARSFVFYLRKKPLTREDTNRPHSTGKNKDQNASVAEINDCSKVERETIAEETRKEIKIPIVTCSKHKNKLSKIPLLIGKNVKVRKSVDRENMDDTEILGDDLYLQIEPFSAPVEIQNESDEILVISDEDEDANNDTKEDNFDEELTGDLHNSEGIVQNTITIEEEKTDRNVLIDLTDEDENNLQSKDNLDADRNSMYEDKFKEEEQIKLTLARKWKGLGIFDHPHLPEKRGKLGVN